MKTETLELIFLVFVCVNIADISITFMFWEMEINPLVLQIGKPGFIIIKFVSILLFYIGIQLKEIT